MLVERIEQYERELEPREPTRTISSWNAGSCRRQLWFVAHHPELAEPLPARVLRIFEAGRDGERRMIKRLRQSGITVIRLRHKYHKRTVEPVGTVIGDTLVYLGKEQAAVDIKTMASESFRRFLNGELSDQYLAQLELQCRAYGVERAGILAENKDNSEIGELWHTRNDELWRQICKHVGEARADAKPERLSLYGHHHELVTKCNACDGTGKTQAGTKHKLCRGTGEPMPNPHIPTYPCGSCPFKVPCWGHLQLVVVSGKERYRPFETEKVA